MKTIAAAAITIIILVVGLVLLVARDRPQLPGSGVTAHVWLPPGASPSKGTWVMYGNTRVGKVTSVDFLSGDKPLAIVEFNRGNARGIFEQCDLVWLAGNDSGSEPARLEISDPPLWRRERTPLTSGCYLSARLPILAPLSD